MAVPVTVVDVLDNLLKHNANLRGLQLDMRNNALGWRAAAVAQDFPAATIAQWMNDAAAEYQKRLGWLSSAQADTTNWALISALWTKLGGTAADYSAKVTPLKAVADQLGPATKNTYAQIISLCDQITTAINAPLLVWPE